MQTVTAAWKANQTEYFVSESFVEITFGVGDPDAQAASSVSDNGHEIFSKSANLTKTVVKQPVKYGTGERNIWVLDGTFKLRPSSGPYGEQGYIGNVLSDAMGDYGTSGGAIVGTAVVGVAVVGTTPTAVALPTVTITFSSVMATLLPGLTITWGEAYNEYATDFRIRAYNGTTLVADKTVTGNTEMTSTVEIELQNYDKIVIEVLRWCLPYRRARIKRVFIGTTRIFTKTDLLNMTHEMTVDPLSAALPKSSITFSISNIDGEYNPDNPEGFTKYLMERQMIEARYGYKIGGAVEWIKAGTFYMSEWDLPQNGITASFTARDALEYMTDVYTGTLSGTLYDIALAALTQASLPIADGAEAWVLDEGLRDVTVPSNPDVGDASIMVMLQYVANAGCCVFYQDRDGIIHIEPLPSGQTDYRIDQFNSYSNSESALSKQLKAVDVNNGQYVLTVGTTGETQPVNNPLISSTQAPVVAAWVADYLTNRKTLDGEFRADPRLDPLDRVTNENQYVEQTVLVTDVKYSYNGAFKGSYAGRAGV